MHFFQRKILLPRLRLAKHDLFAGLIHQKMGVFIEYNLANSILFARLIQQIATYLKNFPGK